MHQTYSAIALLLAAAIEVSVPAQALAQTTSHSGGQDQSAKPRLYEEVVVHGSYVIDEAIDMATGLGLRPEETPQSVSVITAQRIQDQNLTSVADVVINATGVSADEVDDVRNTFLSRGFEIRNYQIDGVPLAWSLAGDSGETMADVSIYQRVEVVRGATGLLTGAGDPSASINLVRKHADQEELTGFVELGVASWNGRQITADVGSALNASGTLRARAVAKYEQGESFVDLYEDQKTVLYGVLEGDITPDTLVRVGASYQHNDPKSPTWGALPPWFSNGTRTNWDRSTTTAADWTRWETTNENIFANVVHSFHNNWQLVFNYNHLENTKDTALLYISGTLDKETGEGLSALPYSSEGSTVQDSTDFQLKGFFNLWHQEHEFVVGALHSEQDAETLSFAPPYPSPDYYNSLVGNFYEWDGSYPEPEWSETGDTAVDLDTEQEGAYAATRLSLSDTFKIIAGARVSSWQRTGINYGEELDFGDDNVLIPYVGALYDLNDHHRLYASYTEIFQPQSARDQNGGYLDPLIGQSSEVGLKSNFLNGALQASAAIFLISQDNLAQAIPGEFVPNSDPNALPEQAYRAAQGTESKGFEVEINGEPLPGWNMSLGYTQYEAEDAEGNDVNTDHPTKLLKVFSTYSFSGALDGLTAGGGINWQDARYSISANPATGELERLEQGAYALVSLMARYQITDKLSSQLNVDNLRDETYYSQVGFFNQYRYGDPRNLTLSLNYRF